MQIRKGNKGNEVTDIQQRLTALGYDLGATRTDGYYGARTERAVKAFQKDHELTETGIVDDETWHRIVDATYRLGSRALYLRSPFFHGDDVLQLQGWLNSIGFRVEPIDGIFGPSTEQAVREFQENSGLTSDGIVGPSTLAALNNLRSILNKEGVSGLSDLLPPDSLVSLMQDQKIAVGCPTPHKYQWLAPAGNQQLLSADLAHRLSNLLEVLGAQVNFFKSSAKPVAGNELAVIFQPGGPDFPLNSIGTLFDHADAACQTLADCIILALTTSLKREVSEILVRDCPESVLPTVTVLLGDLAFLTRGTNLEKDVFKQKIAGAVFDGVKKFIAARNLPA